MWDWASTDENEEPDVVMASAGDTATIEALAATAILRDKFPTLRVRFVNVVDLFRLQPSSEHPHGLSDRDFDSLFTADKPVIFNFHGYASLIHKLAYRRHNHDNMHVRGLQGKGQHQHAVAAGYQQSDGSLHACDGCNRPSAKAANHRCAR